MKSAAKRFLSSASARREARWGLLFLSPWIIGFFLFTLIPMVASLIFSFTDFNLLHPDEIHFVGLKNYRHLFHDPLVKQSLLVTLRFILISVPVGLLFPLLLSTLLNAKSLKGKPFLRTLFYMPYIVPMISAAYIWRGFLGTTDGWLNKGLALLSIKGPDWWNSPQWIYPALVLAGLWGVGNAMLTMLASMQAVPTELYEAAKVDGANPLHTFRHITLPMISPVLFYNLVLILIGTFQYFLLPWVIKGPNGDPGGATMFYNLYLFKTAFPYSDMGYGSTLAWVLFFIILLVTVFLFGTAKYWVYYPTEEA